MQKWSKGKSRDKLANLALFDKATYDKLIKEVPSYKLITPAIVSERMRVRVSLARRAISLMVEKNRIKEVSKHATIGIYTRATAAAATAAPTGKPEKAEKAEKAPKGKKAEKVEADE